MGLSVGAVSGILNPSSRRQGTDLGQIALCDLRSLQNRILEPHHAKGVYIINAKHCISSRRSRGYHQAAGRYTLARDDIQPRRG